MNTTPPGLPGLRSDDGAVAVEFALLLPLLIALLLGIMEFGLLYNAQVTLTNAAREGVRTVAVENNQVAARDDMRAAATVLDPAISNTNIKIAPTGTCAAGVTATVTITYPYSFLTGFFGVGPTLTGRAAMRCGG
jgi:Flp pilus assembly protein TadG